MQWIFLGVLMKRLKAVRLFMKDKDVPFRKKLIIILGILYLFSPIDLIPAPVLGFSVIDDIALWSFIIYYLKDELDKYWVGDDGKENVRKEALKGKDIIDDVNFEVKNESETASAGTASGQDDASGADEENNEGE